MKIGIIGTGFVGSASAFSLVLRGIVNDLVLIDINKNKARMILPYTNPGMNTGIKYAQKKGYSASVSCKTLWADWQGATDNIINEIKNDRPVILYFDGKNFEGKYFKYHNIVFHHNNR